MIDKKLEDRIRQLKEFVDLWTSFYNLYKRAKTQEVFNEDEEHGFLELKSQLARKYQGIMDILGIKPTAEDRTFDVISQVMSLKNISKLSSLQLEKLENDWHNSYITLNKILGSLENKRDQLAKVSVFGKFFKKFFTNPVVSLILIIMVISIVFFLIKNFFA